MRTIPIFLLLLALLAAAAAWLWLRPAAPEWTTDSAPALAELETALAAEMKHYYDDAGRHYEAALAADPGLLIAKLKLADRPGLTSKERAEALRRELLEDPPQQLNDRERLLLRIAQSHWGEKSVDSESLILDYLAQHPDDPWVLSVRCHRLWRDQELVAAERCYQRLLATDPNWVEAQNRLGYIAMAQGRFAEAEERFKTYLYIAPDQANPHDSMGELLTVIGRYEEAEEHLRRSVALRPSFCSSYRILAWVQILQDDYPRARQVLEQGLQVEECADSGDLAEATCSVEIWAASERGDWEEVVRIGEEVCSRRWGDGLTAWHHALVELGRRQEAAALVSELAKHVADHDSDKNMGANALLLHLEADQLLADGEPVAAAQRLRQADQLLEYWTNAGFSIFKLYNQARLAHALKQAGEGGEAAAVWERIDSVNPRFAAAVGGP